MSAPTIEFDGMTYTISLVRDGKKDYFVFGDHSLSVCAAREDELASWQRSQIKAEPDAEGLLYYIHALPHDAGSPCFVGLENKEEALAVNRVLIFLEENEDATHGVEDDDCSFCGGEKDSEDECYVDHTQEMREQFGIEVHSP
ncbi:MAG: hypothetical protein EBY32_19195 [Proteobacteria bacterium]|nr:hypothetical protein [Pseudomonadota bacterium]